MVLNKRQFLNLHDVIKSVSTLKPLNYYPLGGGIWLFRKSLSIKLTDNHSHSFFRFYRNSWYTYVKAHPRLRRFICGRSSHHQSNAKYEHRPSHRFRGVTPFVSKVHKVLSRSTGDACDDYDERSKCANVSQRESSNPRLHSELSGVKYEKQSHHEDVNGAYWC